MNDNILLIFKHIVENDKVKLEKLLNKDKNLLYSKGINLQLPIHDACYYGNEDVINVLLSFDKKILNSENAFKLNGYQILAINYPKLLIKLMKKYKPENIHHVNNFDRTILILYLMNQNKLDEDILKELKNQGCSLLIPENINHLMFIVNSTCKNLDLIKKYFKFDLNRIYKNDIISFDFVDNNDIECFKKLLGYGLDINLSTINGTILSYAIYKNNKDFVKYLIEHKDLDFTYTNKYENTYFHFTLFNNTLDLEIQKEILKKTPNVNKQNIDGDTILHLIFSFDRYDDFKENLISKEVDLNLKNKFNKSPLDYVKKLKIKNMIKSELRNQINIKNIDVKLLNYKIPQFTKFMGYNWTWLSSAYYLITKYKNVGVPICDVCNKKTVDEINSSKLKNFLKILNLDTCYGCSQIIYSKDINEEFYMDPNLKDCLKNVLHKNFIFMGISIIGSEFNHASIIIVDNEKKLIERFETQGSYTSLFYVNLDKKIKKKLESIFYDITNKKYKYVSPNEYQSLFDFQEISTEFNEKNSYIGEKGFCQAWVFWYLEHKILNPEISSKSLIEKLKRKLLNEKKDLLDHIRGYADKLEKFTNKLLVKNKVKKNDIYKLTILEKTRENFIKKISAELFKIQNIG